MFIRRSHPSLFAPPCFPFIYITAAITLSNLFLEYIKFLDFISAFIAANCCCCNKVKGRVTITYQQAYSRTLCSHAIHSRVLHSLVSLHHPLSPNSIIMATVVVAATAVSVVVMFTYSLLQN